MMAESQFIDPGNSIQIPRVGFGTYLIPGREAKTAVLNAIEAGYRHIDTAESYQNEDRVGEGIQAGMISMGLSREQLFVTTKLWPGNAKWGQQPKTYETTIDSLGASLDKLRLEYVDLYLIHAPFDPKQRLEQWCALVELQRRGKVRSIGVSNFSEAHIEALQATGLPLPAVNQIELHPWSQKPKLVSYLHRSGITPIAYSSLLPLATWREQQDGDHAKTRKMQADSARVNSAFRVMAQKYGVSEAQILLRWALQKDYPVLPKSTHKDRMLQNIDLFCFSIDASDMTAIEKMDRGDGVAWSVGDLTRIP